MSHFSMIKFPAQYHAWCTDPMATNCPVWCAQCPDYNADFYDDSDGSPNYCWEDILATSHWDDYGHPIPDVFDLNEILCVYDCYDFTQECYNPLSRDIAINFSYKSSTQVTANMCNGSSGDIMAIQHETGTFDAMNLGMTNIESPDFTSSLQVGGKNWTQVTNIVNGGSQMIILLYSMAHWTEEEQLIRPEERVNLYTATGTEIADHLCLQYTTATLGLWHGMDADGNGLGERYCYNPTSDWEGKFSYWTDHRNAICLAPGEHYGKYIRRHDIHHCPEELMYGIFCDPLWDPSWEGYEQYHEDCDSRHALLLHTIPDGLYVTPEECGSSYDDYVLYSFGTVQMPTHVCLNSEDESQCTWCDNPECSEHQCMYNNLWCCFDTDGSGECDDSSEPVHYCCGETCADCFSGMDMNNDGIDDGTQMLELDEMVIPNGSICGSSNDAIWCCPAKKKVPGEDFFECEGNWNPHLWDIVCAENPGEAAECPDGYEQITEEMLYHMAELMEQAGGLLGCNDPWAWNYHPWAFGGCGPDYIGMSCCDYNNDGSPDGIEDGWGGVTYGCTEITCHNYVPLATVNDGSCCSCYGGGIPMVGMPGCPGYCEKIPHIDCPTGQTFEWHCSYYNEYFDCGCKCMDLFTSLYPPLYDGCPTTLIPYYGDSDGDGLYDPEIHICEMVCEPWIAQGIQEIPMYNGFPCVPETEPDPDPDVPFDPFNP